RTPQAVNDQDAIGHDANPVPVEGVNRSRWNPARMKAKPSGRWSSRPRRSGASPTIWHAWKLGWPASWAQRTRWTSRSPTASPSASLPGAPAGCRSGGSRSSSPRRDSERRCRSQPSTQRPRAPRPSWSRSSMSSLPPSGARSLTPDADPAHRGVVRDRGRALIDALDQHIPGAREHAEATGAYAFAAAAALGFDRNTAELCRETAKLHDIGKLYVPKEILARPAAELDEAGRERMRSQHEAGAGLALGSGIPEEVCVWIRAAGESF